MNFVKLESYRVTGLRDGIKSLRNPFGGIENCTYDLVLSLEKVIGSSFFMTSAGAAMVKNLACFSKLDLRGLPDLPTNNYVSKNA